MTKTFIGENIKALRKSKGWRQVDLAAAIDVTNITVSLWENNKVTPQGENLEALCNAFDCTERDILGYSDGYFRRSNDSQAVSALSSDTVAPVAGRIAAGEPREAIELTDEVHYIDPNILEKYPDGFFLLVQGDSMNLVLPDGCYAFIAKGEYASGDICAVKVNGDDATIKRVLLYDGIVVLQPESTNSEHRRRVFDLNDEESPPVQILGKVVWYDCSL